MSREAAYMPPERDIERVMADTGMQRMQAIYHLRGRKALQTRTVPQRAWQVLPTGRAAQ